MRKIDSFRGYYYFLSNFYPCKISIQGIQYPSAEHAFQAAKTLDHEKRKAIAGLRTPSLAKKEGRRVELRSDWFSKKIQIMTYVVRQKFIQNPVLLGKLLGTGESILIEGNTWGDRFWGMVNGSGENYLGKILMQIRQEYKKG